MAPIKIPVKIAPKATLFKPDLMKYKANNPIFTLPFDTYFKEDVKDLKTTIMNLTVENNNLKGLLAEEANKNLELQLELHYTLSQIDPQITNKFGF